MTTEATQTAHTRRRPDLRRDLLALGTLTLVEAACILMGLDAIPQTEGLLRTFVDIRNPMDLLEAGHEMCQMLCMLLRAVRSGQLGLVEVDGTPVTSPGSAPPDPRTALVTAHGLLALAEHHPYLKETLRDTEAVPAVLDKTHPRYSPELALAITLWNETPQPSCGTVKQALWKTAHRIARQFGFVHPDDSLFRKAIERCVCIANWKKPGRPGSSET